MKTEAHSTPNIVYALGAEEVPEKGPAFDELMSKGMGSFLSTLLPQREGVVCVSAMHLKQTNHGPARQDLKRRNTYCLVLRSMIYPQVAADKCTIIVGIYSSRTDQTYFIRYSVVCFSAIIQHGDPENSAEDTIFLVPRCSFLN